MTQCVRMFALVAQEPTLNSQHPHKKLTMAVTLVLGQVIGIGNNPIGSESSLCSQPNWGRWTSVSESVTQGTVKEGNSQCPALVST